MKNGDKVYWRGKTTDHKAIEIVLAVNVISPRRSGNNAIIDYNNKEGWTKYKTWTDKYAPQIRSLIKKYKN